MKQEELDQILKNHAEYLKTGDLSKRAYLSDAKLRVAYLRGADLIRADLSGAYLPQMKVVWEE